MRFRFVCTLLGVAGLLAATPAAQDSSAQDRASRAGLYGFADDLFRLDPATLRPLPGRRVPLDGDSWAWSFAPGRSRIALVSDSPGPELRLVDLRSMRVFGDVKLARRGSAWATAWVSRRRILGVVVTRTDDTVVAGVDAASRRVVWRRRLGGSLRVGERVGDGLVIVLGPQGRVGESRVVLVSPDGVVQSAQLPLIHSGVESRPGLAVGRSGARAFVVQAGAPVAQVDLRTLEVAMLPLEPGGTPPHATAARVRDVLWLRRGLLAVTGYDAGRPAGLTLVDVRRGSVRTVDERTSDAVVAGGTLLTSSFGMSGRRASGSGLTGYSVTGRRLFHRYGDDPIAGVQPLGRRALVAGMSGIALIDARNGRELRRYRRLHATPLYSDRSFPPTAAG